MIETYPSARHRAAFDAAHKARAAALGDFARRLFRPAQPYRSDDR
ncbi:MAG: hypothetical protein AAGJ91_12005 [Pseudomonadota bacterium]